MIESRKSLEDEGKLGKGGPEFSPRLYKQRYLSVLELARKLQPRKVMFALVFNTNSEWLLVHCR